jgi:hypothetical protein
MAASEIAPSGSDRGQLELAYWDSIKASHDPADFRAYLRKFPHGSFAALAANRVKALETQVRTAAPSVPSEPSAPKGQSDRCRSLLERAQLGNTLSDNDRAYLKDQCR